MVNFKVEFLKNTGVYSPGEVVEGFAILEINGDVRARFVEICLHGKAHTHWTEREKRIRRTSEGHSQSYSVRIPYSATKMYANMSTKVWQSTDGEKMKTGVYKFEFSFTLPFEIPPSFESLYGDIKYYIHVIIDRPMIWNKTFKKSFTVVPIVNLLSVPYAARPIEVEAARKTGLIFKSGVLEFKASVPKRGYVAGEVVPIQLEINNNSKKKVSKLSVKVCQHIKCLARRGTKTHIYDPRGNNYARRFQENVLEKHREVPDIENFSKSTLIILMKIPATVPTFEDCPIIQVTYSIKVKIENDEMFMSSVTCDIPLIIGTIPISVGIMPVTNEAPPSYSMNYMLPIYDESMKAIEKEDFESYCPLYPVLNNLPSAPPEEEEEDDKDGNEEDEESGEENEDDGKKDEEGSENYEEGSENYEEGYEEDDEDEERNGDEEGNEDEEEDEDEERSGNDEEENEENEDDGEDDEGGSENEGEGEQDGDEENEEDEDEEEERNEDEGEENEEENKEDDEEESENDEEGNEENEENEEDYEEEHEDEDDGEGSGNDEDVNEENEEDDDEKNEEKNYEEGSYEDGNGNDGEDEEQLPKTDSRRLFFKSALKNSLAINSIVSSVKDMKQRITSKGIPQFLL